MFFTTRTVPTGMSGSILLRVKSALYMYTASPHDSPLAAHGIVCRPSHVSVLCAVSMPATALVGGGGAAAILL